MVLYLHHIRSLRSYKMILFVLSPAFPTYNDVVVNLNMTVQGQKIQLVNGAKNVWNCYCSNNVSASWSVENPVT